MNFVSENIAQVQPKNDLETFDFEVFRAFLIPNAEQNPGFVAVNPKILELNKAQFIVYSNLLKYRNNETGCAFLRGSKIGFTERHMHRLFESLEALKMIRKVNPGVYFISIQDSNGHLFPCFSRWFWNLFVPSEYLPFRLAVFLGITRLDIKSLSFREIRDALKCRTTAILNVSQSLKGLKLDSDTIKGCIRFRWKMGERKNTQKPIKKEENHLVNLANSVSQVTKIEPLQNHIQEESVSQMSAISSKPEKEDLTKVSQLSFSFTKNFREIGLPEKEIRVSKIEPEAEHVKEYQDILSETEISFCLVLLSHLLKQRQFRTKPAQELTSQAINLLLSLKGRAARLKLNRSILDYFCGTLLVILETNAAPLEIQRRRERAKERAELCLQQSAIQHKNRIVTDKQDQITRAIFDEIKVKIDGWENMNECYLAYKVGAETMEDGTLHGIAKEIKERITQEHANA